MILAIILTMMFMTGDAATTQAAETSAFKSVACDFFTYDNAQKILGKATGADDGMHDIADGRKWGCTFTASDKGEKPPKLYFTIIKATSEDVAKNAFDVIRNSNNKHQGFEEWPGVGDEALATLTVASAAGLEPRWRNDLSADSVELLAPGLRPQHRMDQPRLRLAVRVPGLWHFAR